MPPPPPHVACRRRPLAAWGLALVLALGCEDIRFYDDTARRSDPEDTSSGADGPSTDSGPDPGDTEDGRCPTRLTDRKQTFSIDVPEPIHYLQPGYDGIPTPTRVVLAAGPNGTPMVAWLNTARDTIHVTPLTADYARRGDDIEIPGVDLGGFVVHDDGFALLTRRDDWGTPLAVAPGDEPAQAAYFIRYFDSGAETVTPLTGTRSADQSLTYSPDLRGQLAWNGAEHAAYFQVRGGLDAPSEGLYGGKLVYFDERGAPMAGGWEFAVGPLIETALHGTSGAFIAFALPGTDTGSGLVRVNGTSAQSELLAPEETRPGYSGGAFGGVVDAPDGGHIVVWASRGFADAEHRAEKAAHDIALQRFGPDHRPLGQKVWLTDTPHIDEINVHVAPYGEDHLLLIWNELETLDCGTGVCFGTYIGTYFQRYDIAGALIGESERIDAPPTAEQQLVRYENGDLAYAFVTSTPEYFGRFDDVYEAGAPPPRRHLQVVHLRYCRDEPAL